MNTTATNSGNFVMNAFGATFHEDLNQSQNVFRRGQNNMKFKDSVEGSSEVRRGRKVAHQFEQTGYESIYDREKERKRRLNLLRDTSTNYNPNVYLNLNKSSLNAHETLNMIFKNNPSGKEHAQDSQVNRSIVKLKKSFNTETRLPIVEDLPAPKQEHSTSVHHAQVAAPEEARMSSLEVRGTAGLRAGSDDRMRRSNKAFFNAPGSLHKTNNSIERLQKPDFLRVRKSEASPLNNPNTTKTLDAPLIKKKVNNPVEGFSALAQMVSEKSSGSYSRTRLKKQLSTHEEAKVKTHSGREEAARSPKLNPFRRTQNSPPPDPFSSTNQPLRNSHLDLSAMRSPFSKSPITDTRNSPGRENVRLNETQLEFDKLFKKFQSEKATIQAPNTFREAQNPRKEAQTLKEFIVVMADKLKRENSNTQKQNFLLEELNHYCVEIFSRLLKTEIKDYYEVYRALSQLRDSLQFNERNALMLQIRQLKKSVKQLNEDLFSSSRLIEKQSAVPANHNKSISNIEGESMFAELSPDDGIASRITALLRQVDQERQLKEQAIKQSSQKEKHYFQRLEKVQARLNRYKAEYESLGQMYNSQTDRMNRIKQRLLFYLKKTSPEVELQQDEELLDTELLKKEDEIEPETEHHSEDSIFEEDKQSAHERRAQHAHHNSNMAAVEQVDKFDYSEIYRRRHIWRKCHSQRKNPKTFYPESRYVLYYKDIQRTKNTGADTRSLISYAESSSQTLLSLCDKKYDRFLLNQYDVEGVRKRLEFESEVQTQIENRKFMCFLTDGLMRRLLTLTPSEHFDIAPAKEVELLGELEEHREAFLLNDAEYNELLKRQPADEYFDLQRVDEYLNHRISLPIPASEQLVKYLFLSYVFKVFSSKKYAETLRIKSDQVDVLFKICKKYKDKLKEYDKTLKKTKDDFKDFMNIHRGCQMSSLQNDFKIDRQMLKLPSTLFGPTDKDDSRRNKVSILALINKIKKMKMIMKMSNKKYFSFKIIYQKLHQFFQTRASEVEYIDNKIKHPFGLEEHFFRSFTEKENGYKKIEERIKNFIVTIFNVEPNAKIDLFKRFANLSSSFPYTKNEEFYYLRGIEYIREESRGLDIPPDYHKGTSFVPFDKFESFLFRYVVAGMSPKIASIMWKEVRARVITGIEGFSKKGIIEYDEGMSLVLKWINTSLSFKFSREHAFFLFNLLDREGSLNLDFQTFLKVYRMYNLPVHDEAIRMLDKVQQPKVRKALTVEDMLSKVAGNGNLLPEKPWQARNYIYSENQLKEIFCKYTEQEYSEGVEPAGKLEHNSFHGLINEFENLFTFDKIYDFLNISGESIENEFYAARNLFIERKEIYKKFIEDCRINDNAWKDSFLLRIKELHGLFSSSKQLEEEMKELVNLISQNNVECPNEEKLQNHTMLKVLITHKMFLMDILKADFEQRFDYLDIKELPFE